MTSLCTQCGIQFVKMVRGVATPKKVRDLIIKMFGKGKKMRQIARDLELSKSTVSQIIKSYGENGTTDVKGKSPGRPPLVTDRQRRELVKICKKNRRGTLREVTAEWNEATEASYGRETCRKWIHKSGLGFYKVNTYISTYLKSQHIKKYILGQRKAFINGTTEKKATILV